MRAAVPLLTLLVLAACTAAGPARPRPHRAAQPARDGGARVAHTATGPRDGLDAATFALAGGVTTVTVRVADLGGDLYRIRTPEGAAVAPRVDRDGADVLLRAEDTGLAGPSTVDVALHRAVRWQLRLGAGARDVEVDLRGGEVTAVAFVAGAGRISLSLPAPRGTVPVRMTGGADEFRLRLAGAGAAPARVRVGDGAGSVVIDGAVRTGVPGNTVIEEVGWASAVDRYEIDLAAGVSVLVLDRD